MLDALLWLSEGRDLDASRWRSLVDNGPAFARRAQLGFVVIERERTARALREFAVRAFDLQLIASDEEFDLYVPRVSPGSS
jgi:hypothetical protein